LNIRQIIVNYMKNILKKAKKNLKNFKNSLKVKKLFKKLSMNERKKIP
jgi:hypothetical protein